MNEHLEILWKTYDFALGKITFLEDEYEFLLRELKKFCAQRFHGEMTELENCDLMREVDVSNIDSGEEVDPNVLLLEFIKTTKDLKSYYNKQLASVKELEEYYHEHPYEIPEEREVGIETFAELLEVTVLLRDAMILSTKDIKKILTQE